MDDLGKKYDFENPPLAALVKEGMNGGEQAKIHLLHNLAVKCDRFSKQSEMIINNIQGNPITFMRYLGDLIDVHLTDPEEKRRLTDLIDNSNEARKAIFDFVMEAGDVYGAYATNKNKGKIATR